MEGIPETILVIGVVVLPFAVAAYLLFRKKIWRPLLLGLGLITLTVLGVPAIWKLRDIGYEAFGSNCREPTTRSFMEMATWGIVLFCTPLMAGLGLVSGRVGKWSPAAGFIVGFILLALGALFSFWTLIAAAMTGVDGYKC